MAWGFAFYLIAVGLESFSPLTVVNIRLPDNRRADGYSDDAESQICEI